MEKINLKMEAKKITKRNKGHICFDFDRTIAVRYSGDSIFKLGAPIPKMLALMRSYIEAGRKVKILTARSPQQYEAIRKWLKAQGLPDIEITNVKDSRMDALYDDKGVGINENSGVTHVDMLNEAKELIKELVEKADFYVPSTNLNPVKTKVEEWLKNFPLTIEKDISL